MGKMKAWSVRGLLAASFFVTAAAIVPVVPTAYAADTPTGMFRVALYIQSGKFNTTVPSVGFSAPGGIKIGVRTSGKDADWFSVPGNQAIRVGLNQYQIRMLETASLQEAEAALAATGIKANSAIYKSMVSGKAVYQVLVGDYANKESAQLTLTELLKTPKTAAYAKSAAIAGPLHLSAGSYATKDEAQNKANTLRNSGIPVDLVYQANAAGQVAYSLWTRGEADEAALTARKAALEATFKGLSLTPANTQSPYYIEREDAATGADSVRYLFNPLGQKAWFAPATGKITVKEKNLSYNGGFELSLLNGKLAVVNELPFEQYLNSVVHAELGPGHPKEALKAQAVAARTYSLKAGTRYEIANLTDTTLDQAYYGKEAADVSAAVAETKGEVLKIGNTLIDAFFSSNAGGQTADGTEVWGNQVSYLQSVDSPDTYPQQNKLSWYRIYRDNGTTGYVRSDLVDATGGKTAAGLALYQANDAANVRPIPSADNTLSPSLGSLAVGEAVAVIATVPESTSYSWIRMFSAAQLLPKISTYSPISGLSTLEVNTRGASGRVTGLLINGQPHSMKASDGYRTMLGGLPSTMFEIEESGRYTVLGAAGTRSETTGGGSLYAVTGSSASQTAGKEFLVLGGKGEVRVATEEQRFLFTGKGYGHGLGMSQYGAVGMALAGQDYKSILTHYYAGASIVK